MARKCLTRVVVQSIKAATTVINRESLRFGIRLDGEGASSNVLQTEFLDEVDGTCDPCTSLKAKGGKKTDMLCSFGNWVISKARSCLQSVAFKLTRRLQHNPWGIPSHYVLRHTVPQKSNFRHQIFSESSQLTPNVKVHLFLH